MLRSPTERPCSFGCWQTHYAECIRASNLQTDSRRRSRRAVKTRRPLFFFAIGAAPISPHRALSVSGECKSFTSVPHPNVRNNLQHCWALCHLTLHGQNSQPPEGLNRGLNAWKQWSSNHHIWVIKLNFFPSLPFFFFLPLSKFLCQRHC